MWRKRQPRSLFFDRHDGQPPSTEPEGPLWWEWVVLIVVVTLLWLVVRQSWGQPTELGLPGGNIEQAIRTKQY